MERDRSLGGRGPSSENSSQRDSGALRASPASIVLISWRGVPAAGYRAAEPSVPPPVHATMARPAQELDIAATLATEPDVGPMMHGHRRRAAPVQHQSTPAARTATIARHEPPPAPCPPQQRVSSRGRHEPSVQDGASAQSAPIASKTVSSSGGEHDRSSPEILSGRGRFRPTTPLRSHPPHSPVTPEVAGSSPVAPASRSAWKSAVSESGRARRRIAGQLLRATLRFAGTGAVPGSATASGLSGCSRVV
jgi:hypothetical protein